MKSFPAAPKAAPGITATPAFSSRIRQRSSAPMPVPVISTAFRPVEANELAHNPFRVFTSMLATRDRRYFDPDLRARVETFVERRQLFDPALLARARVITADAM